MNRIFLHGGIAIEGGVASRSRIDQLAIVFPGNDIIQAVSLFSDPEKTDEIIYENSTTRYIYRGYTELGSVILDDDNIQLYMNGTNTSLEKSFIVPEEYLPLEMRNIGGDS